jgi:hypothetical protein
MALYGGIDLHANNSVVMLLNDQDQVIYQKRLPNHLPTILEPRNLRHGEIKGVVVASTYNWYWLVDGLMEADYRAQTQTEKDKKQTRIEEKPAGTIEQEETQMAPTIAPRRP